jgi:hypothetical protein
LQGTAGHPRQRVGAVPEVPLALPWGVVCIDRLPRRSTKEIIVFRLIESPARWILIEMGC